MRNSIGKSSSKGLIYPMGRFIAGISRVLTLSVFLITVTLFYQTPFAGASSIEDVVDDGDCSPEPNGSFLGYLYRMKVSGMYYYVDSGASKYSSQISKSAENWMKPGWSNDISLYPVSSKSGTNVDFYSHGESDSFFAKSPNTIGRTLFFNNNNNEIDSNDFVNLSPWVVWSWSQIHLNDKFSSQSYFQGTITHEIGHFLGLAHENNYPEYSIMAQMSCGRKVQTVQKFDNDMVNYLYTFEWSN